MIPVKTMLSKSEAKAEEPTKLQQRNFHLIVNDGDKSRISILLLTIRRFSVLIRSSDCDSHYDPVASENQPYLVCFKTVWKYQNGMNYWYIQ